MTYQFLPFCKLEERLTRFIDNYKKERNDHQFEKRIEQIEYLEIITSLLKASTLEDSIKSKLLTSGIALMKRKTEDIDNFFGRKHVFPLHNAPYTNSYLYSCLTVIVELQNKEKLEINNINEFMLMSNTLKEYYIQTANTDKKPSFFFKRQLAKTTIQSKSQILTTLHENLFNQLSSKHIKDKLTLFYTDNKFVDIGFTFDTVPIGSKY